jgi:glutamate/tyrosine decarboxylase-like PLP-dependent enzyme
MGVDLQAAATETPTGHAPMRPLLSATLELATEYLDEVDRRPVGRPVEPCELLAQLPAALPDEPLDAEQVVRELAEAVDGGLVASAGPRFFGYVVGGALPAAVAADWLTAAWDQQAGAYNASPAAAVVEHRVAEWLVDLFGLPAETTVGFVTGAAQANLVALAAARWRLLRRLEWDVAEEGLCGAPPLAVLASADRHVTVDGALRLLGIGRAQITDVETDDQGRMRPDALKAALAEAAAPALVCAQAGNVNTGACDPLEQISEACRAAGAWLHVDGAFGMWARTTPAHDHLVAGLQWASSWATDAHKWLNVPYDSGLVFVADGEAHAAATAATAAYYAGTGDDDERQGSLWVPEFSRRARGFTVYAALRSLGRRGIAELVERDCALARRFAERARDIDGVEVLNEIALNQVLLRVDAGDGDDPTLRAIEGVQRDGTFWAGPTSWRGRSAMRVSISGWNTTADDVDRAASALERVVEQQRAVPATSS